MIKKSRCRIVEYGGKWSGHSFWVDEEDSFVISGREDLAVLVRALRKYGSKRSLAMAKEIYKLNTSFWKCPVCGKLKRSSHHESWALVKKNGYKDCCYKCFSKMQDEDNEACLRKFREAAAKVRKYAAKAVEKLAEDEAKKQKKADLELKKYLDSIKLPPDVEAVL